MESFTVLQLNKEKTELTKTPSWGGGGSQTQTPAIDSAITGINTLPFFSTKTSLT